MQVACALLLESSVLSLFKLSLPSSIMSSVSSLSELPVLALSVLELYLSSLYTVLFS